MLSLDSSLLNLSLSLLSLSLLSLSQLELSELNLSQINLEPAEPDPEPAGDMPLAKTSLDVCVATSVIPLLFVRRDGVTRLEHVTSLSAHRVHETWVA